MRSIILISLSLFLLASCSESRKRKHKRHEMVAKDFVFSMEHFFSDEEMNISFPVWFSDSVIVDKGIKKIKRKIYSYGDANESDPVGVKELRTYYFNDEGGLEKIEFEQFYDQRSIAHVTVNYSSRKDDYGFCLASISEDKNAINHDLHDLLTIHHIETYTNKFLAFAEESSGEYLFYMMDREYWGPLSIDSILQPTSSDLVVLGTPKMPHKKYRVDNVVVESDVVEFEYNINDFILEKNYDVFPFKVKRSIERDSIGRCTGFIDSTFTNKEFIKRRSSVFQMENGLPISIMHSNNSSSIDSRYVQQETFEYELKKE